MSATTWTLLLALLLALLLFVGWWWRRQRGAAPLPGEPPPELVLEPLFLTFSEPISFTAAAPRLEAQRPAWRSAMLEAGRALQGSNVRHVFFLHGTFVGSDPFDILPPLRSIMPQMYEKIEPRLTTAMRGMVNRVAGDNGNFHPAYIKLFAEALGEVAACHLLEWSSANHHIARLLGAIKLLDALLAARDMRAEERILLIGHSHARQVFGLLTHLLASSETGRGLWAFLEERSLISPGMRRKCQEKLGAARFDFVTLGGPVRYAWAFLPGMRALHLINHRGEHLLAERPLGFFQTAAGDYVQQWGSIGSDTLATTARERQLNRELDPILGKGSDTRLWFEAMLRRQRLGNFGRTLLIDYGDQSRIRPNFVTTVFGHGVYTRYRCMLFQTILICRYLYDRDIETG